MAKVPKVHYSVKLKKTKGLVYGGNNPIVFNYVILPSQIEVKVFLSEDKLYLYSDSNNIEMLFDFKAGLNQTKQLSINKILPHYLFELQKVDTTKSNTILFTVNCSQKYRLGGRDSIKCIVFSNDKRKPICKIELVAAAYFGEKVICKL